MQVDEYKVLTCNTPDELGKLVTRFVQAGWEPHGRMVIDDGRFYQPIIRRRRDG